MKKLSKVIFNFMTNVTLSPLNQDTELRKPKVAKKIEEVNSNLLTLSKPTLNQEAKLRKDEKDQTIVWPTVSEVEKVSF